MLLFSSFSKRFFLGAGLSLLAASSAAAQPEISDARQTEIVQQYCVACHTDAVPIGGLSFQHFDAANPNPGDAAMIVSKLGVDAIYAAKITPPEQAEQDAFYAAMQEKSAGWDQWQTGFAYDPFLKADAVTASIIERTPSQAEGVDFSLYRLNLSCDAKTGQGNMQVAWAPLGPDKDRQLHVSIDGDAASSQAFPMKGDGTEGSVFLNPLVQLPAKSLTVSGLFFDEQIEFRFDELPVEVRRQFSACFGG